MSKVAIVTGGSRGIGAAISIALKNAGYTVAANYAGNDEAATKFKAETGIPVYKWSVADYDACVAGIKPRSRPISGRSTCWSTMPASPATRMFHKMTPRAVERGDRHQPVRRLQHDASGVERHARPQIRPHHHHLLDQRPEGPGRPGQLFRGQGRRHRLHQGAGAGRRARRHHRQRRSAPATSPPKWSRRSTEKVLNERIIPQIPVGRLGEPEEIARCVVFLASDEAGFITGSTIAPMAASSWSEQFQEKWKPVLRPALRKART